MSRGAIEKIKGPCIIMAGAGTGKTYTIIEKIKHLITSKAYDPEKIVCLTFSNEAVATLRARITKALPHQPEPIISTFHSFCADLLKNAGTHIGVQSNFRILVPDEAKIVLHKNLKVNPNLCSKYIETLGIAKDLGITPAQVNDYIEKKKRTMYSDDLQQSTESLQFELNTRHAQHVKIGRNQLDEKRERLKQLTNLLKLQKFVRAWSAYEKIKDKRNMLDYADLHTRSLELLQKNPSLTEEFDYLIVDEFQDTNKMQFDLLVLLAPHKNITVVGDLNQSIYRFRGAYKENMTAFKERFAVKESDIYPLEKSFRSPNTVLRLANKLIEKEKTSMTLYNAHEREGEKIQLYELKNDKEETRKVVELIELEKAKGTELEEICIMFRTHQQSQRLKRALEEKQIPYVAVIKGSLLEVPRISRILNYLTIAHALAHKKPRAENAWWDLMHAYNLPKEDIARIGRELKKHTESPCLSEELYTKLDGLEWSEEAKPIIQTIRGTLEHLKEAILQKKSILEHITLLTESKEELSPEARANDTKFKEWVEDYTKSESPELDDFLYHVSIMRKLGINLETARTEQKGVRIMTHHATKGLEYTAVIITNLAQTRFPIERSRSQELLPAELLPDIIEQIKDTPDYLRDEAIEAIEKGMALAEERRLCYVACTRARQRLYMTFAQDYGSRSHRASPFLTEMNYTENPDIVYTQDLVETPLVAPTIVSAEAYGKKIGRKRTSFSPSALLLFKDCQKKYEYKYVYHMPEKEPTSWEEMRLGSFVHKVLEDGVRALFRTEEEFVAHARKLYTEEEWKQINLDEALSIIRVFYQRNRNKYGKESHTEIKLRAECDGIAFEGYADRIDVHPDGLEIVDYKTGKTFITAQHRNWQLGIYALAAESLGMGPVRKMTLDMLRHEKPYEFELQPDGIAVDVHAPKTRFNLHEVKKELLETARNIQDCQEKGFTACDIEDNCDFCNEFVWKRTNV